MIQAHVRSGTTPEVQVIDGWAKIAIFLILGYYCMSRSFSYLGFSAWHIFIGELVLASFMCFGPPTKRGRWIWMVLKEPLLKKLVQAFSILFVYGIFQVFRGIYNGNPPLSAVRDLAFNYYPLFLLLGIWAGLRYPQFLPRAIRLLAWFNGMYGVLYLLIFSKLPWLIPGIDTNTVDTVPVFGQPFGSAIALLGLVAFEKNLRSVWYLFFLNLFVLLGMQIRGEWLSFAIGLLLWSWLTKQLRKLVFAMVYIGLLLSLMFVVDFSLAGPEGRGGGAISVRDLVGRAIAPINSDIAAEYTSNYETDTDTALWRMIWWVQIVLSVHQRASTAVLGLGYGFPLGDLVPYLRGRFIRTPHNFFLYVLGYSGWVGIMLFFWFQLQLLRLLRLQWKQTRQCFGLLFWVASFVFGSFTAFFETPYGAIPFYLILGSAIAPALAHQGKTQVQCEDSQRVAAARRSIASPSGI